MKDIVDWAESPFGFYVDRHYIDGQWLLEPGPIRLARYHRDILRHCFTPNDAGRLPYDVIGWAEPAKSGKSAIAGLIAEFAALHLEKNSTVVMASNKQQQAASLMFKSVTDSIALNRHLPGVTPGRLAVDFSNGNTVKAIASNSKGEAGARFSLALFDELWGYIHQDAERLWTEFKTDPTRLNSVKFAIGYAGYLSESNLWQDLLESGLKGKPIPELAHIQNADGTPACWQNGRTFVFWSHVCRQPWQTEDWIAEQRRTLRPAEFSRMIETLFVESEANFIDFADWEALISPGHNPLPPGSPERVFVGLDLATAPGGDDCALIGVYADEGLVKVAFHKVWKGKKRREQLKLKETVYPYLVRVKADYNLAGVWFDPWQALALSEDLRKVGLRCIEVPQTHSSRGPKDTALLEIASNRQLMLYDHPDLRTMASGAAAKELGSGLIFLKKAGRAKIDLLIALSNVANEAIFAAPQWRSIPFLSFTGNLTAGTPTAAPTAAPTNCPNCRRRLAASRSRPDELSCTYCGFVAIGA